MRSLLTACCLIVLSGCANSTGVVRATMPFELYREDGGAARMGDPVVQAGGYRAGDPFYFTILFHSDGQSLGEPHMVAWQVPLGEFCRDQVAVVRSVLIGPQGQIWTGDLLPVPAGPDRGPSVTVGHRGEEARDIMDAVGAGGLFRLALQDAEGRRWNEHVIEAPTKAERERLFAANRARFAATDSATVPVRSDLLVARYEQPYAISWPPRACPPA